MATLRFIASTPEGSSVVFDYAVTPERLNPLERDVFEARSQRVASAGEPWQAFFKPPSLVSDLHALGFKMVKDLGSDEINNRYFNDRADGLKVGGQSHLIVAQV